MRLLGEEVDGSLDGGLHVEVQFLEVQLAGLDLGEVQDVVDDGQERVARGADRLDVLALFLRDARVQEQARHADDPVHGGADLVAHVRQELALERGGAQGRVAGLGEFFLNALPLGDLLMEDAVGLGELGGTVFDARFQVLLRSADDLFGVLAFGDIRTGADPLAYPAVAFEHGHAACHEVPVGAVGHAHAVLVLVDRLCFQRPAPEFGGALAVVGMDDVHPAVVAHFLEGLARRRAPVGQILGDATLGVSQPHDLRAGGHERTVALLAAQGRLAGALLVVDVHRRAEPLHDLSLGVTHGHRAAQVPAVGAVLTAAQADLRLVRLAGQERLPRRFQRAFLVVRVHRLHPAAVA